MACGRGFKSPQLHHIENPTSSLVGFFSPVPACSVGFTRVLADFALRPVGPVIAAFCSPNANSLRDMGVTEGPKSAKGPGHDDRNQQLTRGRIKRLIFSIGRWAAHSATKAKRVA